jgi:hypothetical protein
MAADMVGASRRQRKAMVPSSVKEMTGGNFTDWCAPVAEHEFEDRNWGVHEQFHEVRYER